MPSVSVCFFFHLFIFLYWILLSYPVLIPLFNKLLVFFWNLLRSLFLYSLISFIIPTWNSLSGTSSNPLSFEAITEKLVISEESCCLGFFMFIVFWHWHLHIRDRWLDFLSCILSVELTIHYIQDGWGYSRVEFHFSQLDWNHLHQAHVECRIFTWGWNTSSC